MLSMKTTHNRCVFTFDTFPATPMHVEHENTPSLVCFRVRYLFFTSGKVLNTNTHPRWCVFTFGTFLATTTQRGRSSSPFLSHPHPSVARTRYSKPGATHLRRSNAGGGAICPPSRLSLRHSNGCFFLTSPAISLDIYIILNTYTYNII